MNSLPSSVERENLGQILLENLQEITDKLDKIVTDSDRIILDNLLQETKILLDRVKYNSKTYQARADIFGQINQLWLQVCKQYRDEDSALELIRYIDQFTNPITAYNQLFSGLAQINEGRTGEEKADLIRLVEGSLILSETIDVFIDMFADSELEQINKFAQNALSFSNRTISEYFQDTDKSRLVTRLRAYSSLIIFRIKERFNPKNVSLETSSHSLTYNFNDLDPWTRNLVGVKADLIRRVEGSLILSEKIDVFIDMFADSELEQINKFAQNALSFSNRTISEYFQDTDKSSLVTQLRAYYSLIIFRIKERFNPKNVSSETTSHSLTYNFNDLDPWTRNLVGVKADLIRRVEGSLILSEKIDVFIDMFADSELEQINKFAQNALSFSNRTISEYFQDTDKSSLVTQLRAYYSLIIFRIKERFNPKNVSSETTSHSLTDDLSDLDSWTRNLVGVVDLGSEDPKESYIDYLVEKYR
jgi:hypothetical protein